MSVRKDFKKAVSEYNTSHIYHPSHNLGKPQRKGPLRLVTKGLEWQTGGIRTQVYVELECGHNAWTHEGVTRVRCTMCATEGAVRNDSKKAMTEASTELSPEKFRISCNKFSRGYAGTLQGAAQLACELEKQYQVTGGLIIYNVSNLNAYEEKVGEVLNGHAKDFWGNVIPTRCGVREAMTEATEWGGAKINFVRSGEGRGWTKYTATLLAGSWPSDDDLVTLADSGSGYPDYYTSRGMSPPHFGGSVTKTGPNTATVFVNTD